MNHRVLWRVTGELATESGTAGVESWLYITDHLDLLPDLTRTFYYHGSSNGRDWYLIERVERLGETDAVTFSREEVVGFMPSE